MAWPASSSTATRKAAPTSRRLDVWLVEHGLAESREKAQALVMAGPRARGRPARYQGRHAPSRADAGGGRAPGPEHVGRGALKLEGALDAFGVDPAAGVPWTSAPPPGGFTETLLRRGATRVYAVDVGRGQLHERLRAGRREWSCSSAVNARHLSAREVPEPCGLATVDVSFISVTKLLAPLRTVLARTADVLVWSSRSSRSGAARSAAVVS
jgi:23S rRNA (cytidine1920-2'-O)/16S rRNA (cytidine1409-2'-O)-methyltransferase